MNKVIQSGRLTKDPQVYENNGKKSVRFTLAVQRDFKDADGKYGTDFPSFVAFGRNADFIEKYFHKGSWMEAEGALRTGSYKNKDGQTVYTTDVWVDKAGFGGASKSDNDKAAKADAPKAEDTGFMNIPEAVDDLPFGG